MNAAAFGKLEDEDARQRQPSERLGRDHADRRGEAIFSNVVGSRIEVLMPLAVGEFRWDRGFQPSAPPRSPPALPFAGPRRSVGVSFAAHAPAAERSMSGPLPDRLLEARKPDRPWISAFDDVAAVT
jgi:hypothetical protein